MMKKQFYNYFYYTRKERNGAIVLVALCLLVSFAPRLYSWLAKPKSTDFAAFQKAIDDWNQAQIIEPDSLFEFDPNTASAEDLGRLGVPPKTIKTMLNYREKGGRFYQKEDLKKIYGFPTELYHQLEPYIKLVNRKENSGGNNKKKTTYAKQVNRSQAKKTVRIDINQADAEEWRQLRGIGPVLSERIVKFRDKLGGFTMIEQVAETYGLPDSTFQSIHSQLTLSPVIRKIAINQVDAATLQQHPYLNWRQAKAIINYRELHGPFGGIEDMKKLHLLSDDLCNKLIPYLEYEVQGTAE